MNKRLRVQNVSNADRIGRALALFGSAVLVVTLLVAVPALAQTATYRVTFDTTWTEETHPTSYPPNPHYSGLVGGTHDGTVHFWRNGELASLGMKQMAEWGSQNTLLDEVQDAIDAGQAQFTLSDAPLWDVPGSTSFEFAIGEDFSLVSLVAMIAPSPDWFIGVESLDLRPGGAWAEEIVVDLFPWDAGTDSGQNYTSFDNPTTPPVPVFPITGGKFTPGVPLGTMTFTRLSVSAVPEALGLQVAAYPNPFNPQTTIAWELPRAGRLTVEIFDLRGRRVDTLWDRTTEAGAGQTVWNGTDRTGRSQISGKYFYRLSGTDFVRTGSMILAK